VHQVGFYYTDLLNVFNRERSGCVGRCLCTKVVEHCDVSAARYSVCLRLLHLDGRTDTTKLVGVLLQLFIGRRLRSKLFEKKPGTVKVPSVDSFRVQDMTKVP
jgi:hypothetical protein